MKTRIQAATAESSASDEEKLSILGVLERILREEGFMGYYRGFVATMLNTFSMRPMHSADSACSELVTRLKGKGYSPGLM